MISLDAFVGKWSDAKKSKYELSLDAGGASISVRTTRPDGIERFTKALIRLQSSGKVVWGQNYELDPECDVNTSSVNSLKRLGFAKTISSVFVWTRESDALTRGPTRRRRRSWDCRDSDRPWWDQRHHDSISENRQRSRTPSRKKPWPPAEYLVPPWKPHPVNKPMCTDK